MPVVDGHCDTLTVLTQQNRTLGYSSSRGHLDLPRLRQGGIDVQFFAIFVGPENSIQPVSYTNEIITLFQDSMLANSSDICHVKNSEEIKKALSANKICAVLTIEGGEALRGSIEQLEEYYRQGVRALTLTWNGRNELADGVGLGKEAGGLTVLGRQVVQRMAEIGMIIDVSHISQPSFWDVMSEVKVPLVASHSNCFSLCNHPRNLTDEQVRAIAVRGGVIGVTFVPQFIDLYSASLDRLLDHIEHLYKVGGIACIGLGSDFDGIDDTTAGLEHAGVAVPNISSLLRKRGFSSSEVDKILGDNWLRLFKDVCG
ncbi:peptidase [Desulforamulus ferrireducens]|uniref:Peptidase n=1 Tax=Desulforamulus ferrireducens TaxID=1833852 RepID=A0A1S6IWZ4_9FIRM|nr:peptidase [Desulforamulus ferrireducens]